MSKLPEALAAAGLAVQDAAGTVLAVQGSAESGLLVQDPTEVDQDDLNRKEIAESNQKLMKWDKDTVTAMKKAEKLLLRFESDSVSDEIYQVLKVLHGEMGVKSDQAEIDRLNAARIGLIFEALKSDRLSDDDPGLFISWGYRKVEFSSINGSWEGLKPVLVVRGEGAFAEQDGSMVSYHDIEH